MKILHFLPWYSPHTKGGTEIFMVTLAKSQSSYGHHVEIICPNIIEQIEIDSIENIKITYFPFPYGTDNAEILYSKSVHKSVDIFESIIEDINPDIIHLHGFHTIYLGYFQRLKKKYLILLTPHLVDVICPKHNLINYKNEYCDGLVELKKCAKCITFSKYQNVSKTVLSLKIKTEISLLNYFNNLYKYHFFSIAKNVISKINCIEYFKANMNIDALIEAGRQEYDRR